MSGKLDLGDVTLVAADCVHPDLAARALEICLAKCAFADAILYSDTQVAGTFRCETIDPLRSADDYSRFCLAEIPRRTATPFVLIVQWDGYIVDANAWASGFRRHDYIGAVYHSDDPARRPPWVVGNGGFSLRSRKLLDVLPTLPNVVGLPEDRAICETFRTMLERDHGIRFAPERLAERFSFQQRPPARSTFGFHGLYNMPRVENDDTILRIVSAFSHREFEKLHFFALLHHALSLGRDALARDLYARLRQGRTADEVRALAAKMPGMPETAQAEIAGLAAEYAT